MAKRPLILAGGGIHISEAHQALLDFSRAQGIPVAHTMSGKGAIACSDPHSAGLFGRYDRIANGLMAESDCLLVLGCKLGEIATKRFSLMTPGKPVISPVTHALRSTILRVSCRTVANVRSRAPTIWPRCR
jgi:acetolactate synthase I/II/III large subunit